ncbi:ADP-ribosyl cyclase/cyclic ADP-ribose hydrolase 1-like isoform X1 [Anabas testudineus]|uniref:ADP-ribosyl cyclase/cyclic ADP-ribose hydrolase 1-like isoform X1 n=1 Tax=Anabas testudineus TaxID=64144 RepID=UPI000E462776|nr:ADP-ribosyl cyclase/cyclic ADP-ribose hydrolase 1-like isoform X1 [Anabas testudineus]
MEDGASRPVQKTRRRRCVFICVAVCLVVLVVVLAVALALVRRKASSPRQAPLARKPSDNLKATFTERCEAFKGYNCGKIWDAFTQAYVGRDPCDVPMEAYDPLIAAAPFKPERDKMMFWSKTEDVVLDLGKRDCCITMKDTLLGSVLDGLTWCGKKGSKETFTTDCPGWTGCEKNPVRSFWNRASAAFADVACGDVTVMLNGDINTPFSSDSIFASIEVKKFSATGVKSLNVILVTQKNPVANCENASLKDLQKELDGIKYTCKEVAESQIQECSSKPEKPCGACW